MSRTLRSELAFASIVAPRFSHSAIIISVHSNVDFATDSFRHAEPDHGGE